MAMGTPVSRLRTGRGTCGRAIRQVDQNEFFSSHEVARTSLIIAGNPSALRGSDGEPCMSVELVLAAAATIGESPTWVPEDQALYWIDVKAAAPHWLDPTSLATRHWLLGGPGLETLYITSAADKLTAAAREKKPLAGGVFRFSYGMAGVPRPYAAA